MMVVSTCLDLGWEQAYGSKEGVAGQLTKIRAEAIATLHGRMLRELLRWAGRIRAGVGRVHGEPR